MNTYRLITDRRLASPFATSSAFGNELTRRSALAPQQRQRHIHSSVSCKGSSVSTAVDMATKRARGDVSETNVSKGEYPDVMAPRPMSSAYLPGLTRSVYERDHAVITQESRVWCG